MKVREDISEAILNNKPVVALESTIITHGMPYPENVKTAIEVENVVKENGGIPATIGVIDGNVIIGLTADEIDTLARSKYSIKISTREIPLAIAKKLSGGTTVSATSFLAELSKIKVFVTGGLGGVHREVIETFDISRDLEELSLRDIIIVSSGVKSILDVQKTFEYLETKGILVVGYKTNEFPTFYSSRSGLEIPEVDEKIVSYIFKEKLHLGIKGAILVANPIPKEYEIPFEKMEEWIEEALSELKQNNIHGKQVTPFLLSRIHEISHGESLEANIALIKSNAKVGTLIAKELVKNGLD